MAQEYPSRVTPSLRLVQQLAAEGFRIFSTEDVRKIAPEVGLSKGYVLQALHHLVRTGWLVRLRKGLYALASTVPGASPVHEFEVGIGTIAGSALFNLLVIPGVCVLVSPKIFQVSREVIDRDALFYIVSVFILLVLTLYFKFWGVLISIFLILVYVYYISEIVYDTKKTRDKRIRPYGINLPREIFSALVLLGGIGLATYFLTESSINLASIFGVAPVIVAFTITAAATSVPDTVLSVVNARKGDLDDAASNVFGSNIFNILFGLGFPLLLYTMIKGKLEIVFGHVEIIIGLLGSTIMVLYFFARREMISKRKGIFLILLYVLFVIYVALIG
jgi:cation:H+ antiporter